MKDLQKFLYQPIIWLFILGVPFVFAPEPLHVITGMLGVTVRIMGLLLVIYGFLLHGVAVRTLRYYGHSERSRSIWPDKLVTRGIYSCMRHPQHLGLGLVLIGIAMLMASPITVISSGWAVAAILVFVLHVEELDCLRKFGSNYYEYMRITLSST